MAHPIKQWAAVSTTSSDTRAPPQASFPWCFSLASQGHGEGAPARGPSPLKDPQAGTDGMTSPAFLLSAHCMPGPVLSTSHVLSNPHHILLSWIL